MFFCSYESSFYIGQWNDDLHDKSIHHLRTLPVWEGEGIFTSSNNIPGWAMQTGLVKRIK